MMVPVDERKLQEIEAEFCPAPGVIREPSHGVPELVAEVRRLAAALDDVTASRDAYRRAKSENDERFMRERDEARDALAAVIAERDRLQRACDEGLPREYLECPSCHAQHIEGARFDRPEIDGRTRPHHTHRCYHCEHVWDSGRWSFGANVPKPAPESSEARHSALRECLEIASACAKERRNTLARWDGEGVPSDDERRSWVGCKTSEAERIRDRIRALLGGAPGEPDCTGVSAHWCPRCGDCACPLRFDENDQGGRTLNDPKCPLHAPTSPHGEELAAPRPAERTVSALCECTLRACASGEAMSYMIVTGHHPTCSRGFSPSARQIIADLVRGMEVWARDEDGVHPAASAAYEAARSVVADGDGGAK